MRRRTFLSLVASCAMAACAHQSPSAMPGMAWSLNHADGEGDKLAFGQPSSDNVVLMMTCEPRSGDVQLSLAAGGGAPGAITLESRGVTGRYLGEPVPSMGEGGLLEAQAHAGDPALVRFARTGDLAVVADGRRTTLPVRLAERPRIQAFFNRCAA